MFKSTSNIFKLKFVPSYQFNTTLSKEIIDEFISIIMTETGVQSFGYKTHTDEYWGKLKINNETIHFTITFTKTLSDTTTTVFISTFNATQQESERVSTKICETIKIFENSQSVYKKKHSYCY
jgi:hypothetical protein